MKLLPLLILTFAFFHGLAQQNEFEIEGRLLDSEGKPVADANVINLRTQERSVSLENGVFSATVLPSDSLAILHISFNNKFIRIFDLATNPVVELERNNTMIGEINVTASRKSDYQRAQDNIASLSEIKLYNNQKIGYEPDASMQMMIGTNRVLRSEAQSIRIYRFSPSEVIGKLFRKLKKKKRR